jgi:hypothetical protein
MRRAASLHADRARLDLGEEFDDPRTTQSAFRGGAVFALQRVDLKAILGNVDANSDIFPHGQPPSWWRSGDHLSALRCPLGGAVHIIKGEALSGFRRLGMPVLSARSLALDRVSWAQGGKVENAVGR